MSRERIHEVSPPYRAAEYRSPYQPLIDELYKEEILAARRMSPEEKILAGEELFHYACSITLEGIRNQNPHFTPEECQRELERRLALADRLNRRA